MIADKRGHQVSGRGSGRAVGVGVQTIQANEARRTRHNLNSLFFLSLSPSPGESLSHSPFSSYTATLGSSSTEVSVSHVTLVTFYFVMIVPTSTTGYNPCGKKKILCGLVDSILLFHSLP